MADATSVKKDSCDKPRSLNVTKISDDDCTRNRILKSIEPIIESFNNDDVSTIAKSLTDLCASNVCIKIQLFSESSSDNVSANACPSQQFTGTGVSYLMLLWRFLRMTHPKGTMEIVDKRICYRLLVNKPKGQDSPRNEDHAFSAMPPDRSSASAPVSIVEAVVKFLGLCVATLPLHDLYCGLAEGLVTDMTPPVSTNSAGEPELIPADVSSAYISSYIRRTQETVTAASDDPNPLCSVSTDTTTPTASEREDLSERQHGYILEHALVFDERARVTEWAFSVLAAEVL